MNRYRARTFATTALVAMAVGCAEPNIAGAALSITVVDAVTGADLLAGATVTVRDGDFVESRRGEEAVAPREAQSEIQRIWMAEGRPGRYDVTVSHPGYEDWHRSDVVVTTTPQSDFHGGFLPETVHLRAEMQPTEGR